MRRGVRKDYLKGSRRHHRGHSPYPFDRFLASRLGRPWDEVYSELCDEFDSRTFAGYRFRRDLRWHVYTNVYIGAETGAIYSNDGWNFRLSNDYYVHPWTGLLCYAPRAERERPEPEVTCMTLDGTPIWDDKNLPDTYLEKIDGIWYRFEITRRWMEKDYLGREYERRIITRSQLGKKALRKHHLHNDPPTPPVRCEVCGFAGRCVHAMKAEAERKARTWGYAEFRPVISLVITKQGSPLA